MDNEPDFADSLPAQLIAEMVGGGETLVDACRALGVPYSTIFRRIRESTRFAEMMEAARETGYDVIANECLTIADDATNDVVEGADFRGQPTLKIDKDNIQRSKLRVETRLKLLAKWHPKRYGEKLQVESVNRNVVIPATDDPIAAQRAYEDFMKGS